MSVRYPTSRNAASSTWRYGRRIAVATDLKLGWVGNARSPASRHSPRFCRVTPMRRDPRRYPEATPPQPLHCRQTTDSSAERYRAQRGPDVQAIADGLMADGIPTP